MSTELKDLVKQFFKYLDETEVSDSGKVFHPTSISCCRSAYLPEITKLLQKMKEAANEN